MATKKNKLTTGFDGDDKPFQKKIKRVQGSVKKTSGMLKGMGMAIGTAGLVAGLSKTIQHFDRIDKIATRMGMSAEALQRLGHAANLSGSNMEQLQGIMTRLERRTGEALQNTTGSQAQRFKELNIEVEAFSKLNPEDKILAIADAFNALGGTEQSIASLMGLLDTEVRELLPLLKQGSDGIQKMMGEIGALTDKETKAMAAAQDEIGKFKQWWTLTFGKAVGGIGTLAKAGKFIMPWTKEYWADMSVYSTPEGMKPEEARKFSYTGVETTAKDRRLMEKWGEGDLRRAQKFEQREQKKFKFQKDLANYQASMAGIFRGKNQNWMKGRTIDTLTGYAPPVTESKTLNKAISDMAVKKGLEAIINTPGVVGGKALKKHDFLQALMGGDTGEKGYVPGIVTGKALDQHDLLQALMGGDTGAMAKATSSTSGRFGEFVAAATLGAGQGRMVSQRRGIRIEGIDKQTRILEDLRKHLDELAGNTTP